MERTEEVGGLSGREARRKKIMERGLDRMSIITGRIQPQPFPSSSSSSKHSHTQSSPPLFFQSLSSPQPHVNPSDQIHVGHDGEDETNAFDTSTKHDIKKRLLRENAFNLGIRVEPQLRKCETNIRPIQAPDVDVKNEEQPLPLTPKVPKTSADKEVLSKTRGGRFHFLTAKEINSCIVLSESTRVFCSIIIAVLVVLSNINLPSNIVKPRSTIASRPLYILLLTDVTIVLIRLLEKRRDFEKSEEDKKPAMQENGYNWAGAIQILEIGLVFYQVIRALFIDCSFYMVVVICGLSLV